jgi:hypothetical protein
MKVRVKKVVGKEGFTTIWVRNISFDGIVADCGSDDPEISSYIDEGPPPLPEGNKFFIRYMEPSTKWFITASVKNSGKKVVGNYSSTRMGGCTVRTTAFVITK